MDPCGSDLGFLCKSLHSPAGKLTELLYIGWLETCFFTSALAEILLGAMGMWVLLAVAVLREAERDEFGPVKKQRKLRK
jgi:hypothetical protein